MQSKASQDKKQSVPGMTDTAPVCLATQSQQIEGRHQEGSTPRPGTQMIALLVPRLWQLYEQQSGP